MSFLDDLTQNARQRIGLLVGGVLLLLLLDWTYLYGPRAETLEQRRDQVAALRIELDAKRTKSGERETFEHDLRQLAGELRQAEARLPDEREIATLLSNIASNARAVGMELTLFRNRQETFADFYAEVPVEMNMQGTYHELAQFLDRVKRMDRIVNVSNIAVRNPRITGDLVVIDASCTATTFRFLDEEERERIKAQQELGA